MQLIQTKQHLHCTIIKKLYTQAYSETFNIDILLLNLHTTVHIYILMWGAVGSDAVDVGRIWLGRR